MPEPLEALPILSMITARRPGVVIRRLRESEGMQKISSPPVQREGRGRRSRLMWVPFRTC